MMAANQAPVIELGPGDAWAYPRGTDEMHQRLMRFISNLTLAEFTTVIALLEECLPNKEDRAQLRQGMHSLQKLPAQAVRRVVTHPLWIYWVRSTGQIICAFNEKIPVPKQWRGHLRPDTASAAECLRSTAQGFSQLVLASHVVAGREIEVTIPVTEKSYLTLPGTGLSYNLRHRMIAGQEPITASVQKKSEQYLQLDLSTKKHVFDRIYFSVNGQAVAPVHDSQQTASNWLNAIKFSDREIELDNRDECYLSNWVKCEIYPAGTQLDPVADSDLPAWCKDVTSALELLGHCYPHLQAEILSLVRSLIPVRSNVPEHSVSCSNRDFFGAVQLSAHPGIALAEVLVHEYRHNILNAIIDADPILNESNPTEAMFFSPWRKDPRPLIGLFHGIYSFMEVVGFYLAYLDYYGAEAPQAKLAGERIVTNTYRLVMAVEDFVRDAELTPFGTQLVEGVQERVGQFQRRAMLLDDALWKKVSNEVDQQLRRAR
jgi:HEXXH motif-containing protein